MNIPLVSVIIPVYNVENYIVQCIDSLINQTYKNIEIILIDDGSTDESHRILREYEYRYENITLIVQRNSGQSVARNKGIAQAKGKYIYFLDSDDYIELVTLENLIKKMEDNGLDLIRFSGESFSENNDFIIDKNKYNFQKYFSNGMYYNKIDFLKINFKTFTASPVLYVVKKSVITENNIEFTPFIIHEDELFTLEVFLNVNSAMYDPNIYYNRRVREGSTMTSKGNATKSFNSRCIVVNQMNNYLNNYTNPEELELIKSRLHVNYRMIFLNEQVTHKHKKKEIKKIKGLKKRKYIYYQLYSKYKRLAQLLNSEK